MRRGLSTRRLASHAPRFLAAVLTASLALSATACRKHGTPDWNSAPSAQSAPKENPKHHPKKQPSTRNQAPQPATDLTTDAALATSGLRFITYNIENWLIMDRVVDHKTVRQTPKPDSQKKAVVRILANNSPDVVGICEIGQPADLTELRDDLKSAGLDLPFSHYTGGADPVRHLALLSRFPITSTAQPAETEFRMKGQTFAINRGILDATIQARGKSYRFIGVHLKSRREIPGADQEDMRVNEARLVRRHLDSILKSDPDARLIVYGDFNDNRPSTSFKTITVNTGDPTYLTVIPCQDSHGETWTHYWASQDIYSRFDYVIVTRPLKPEIDFRSSRIIDEPAWAEASDHRPLLAVFR